MGHGFIFYVVVDPEGNPRKRGSKGFMIYDEPGVAKAKCREGDAVVRLPMDLSQEPMYIKGRPIDTDEDED